MFSLIITIIAIALVAALAVASIYYGGDAMTKGTAKAAASTVINGAQQISAANTLYRTDNSGANAADVTTLVSNNYLAAAPALPKGVNGSFALDTGSVLLDDFGNEEVCNKINETVGVSTAPTITPTNAGAPTAAELAAAVTSQYGCAVEGTAPNAKYHFIYK